MNLFIEICLPTKVSTTTYKTITSKKLSMIYVRGNEGVEKSTKVPMSISGRVPFVYLHELMEFEQGH